MNSTVSNQVNATCNWWGSANINLVTAEVVNDNVVYMPYLTTNASTPSTYGFYPTGPCQAPLPLNVLLQGPYAGGGLMNTDLKTAGNIPFGQPYNVLPWSYGGTEYINPIPADVVDWVLVEFRVNKDVPSTLRVAGLLDKYGSVTANFTGVNQLTPYYIVIHHRNHMPVMTATPIVVRTFTFPYDFTVLGNLYGYANPVPNVPAINLGGGVYGMIAGDVTKNGMLKYSGPNNDRGPIIARIVAENGGSNDITKSTPANYWQEDVNLNSYVLYIGTANDRGIIQANLNTLTGAPYLNNTYTTVVPGAYTGGKDGSNEGPVDIQFAETAEELAIEIITNELVANGMVDNIQFTLAWETGDTEIEQMLSTLTSSFYLMPQGNAIEVEGINYLTFVSVTPTYLPQAWNTGEAVTVMTFEKEYGQLISTRLWIADNDFTVGNNGEFYVSNWGTDVTGMILNATVGVESANAGYVKLYPNPVTSGKLFMEINADQHETLVTEVWDMTGKLIMKLDNQVTVGTSTLIFDVY